MEKAIETRTNSAWKNLPKNIQKSMVKYYIQEFKGSIINDYNIQSAISIYNHSVIGGFTWTASPEGYEMWGSILLSGNLKAFRKYYMEKITQYLIDYGYF